jgi:hypothetical protein
MKEYDDNPFGSKYVTLLFQKYLLFFLSSSCVRLYSLLYSDKEMLGNHSDGFTCQYKLVPPFKT